VAASVVAVAVTEAVLRAKSTDKEGDEAAALTV
jgi:hypothetical protein